MLVQVSALSVVYCLWFVRLNERQSKRLGLIVLGQLTGVSKLGVSGTLETTQ